ncbi:MAG: HU family DNA-binding protein [Bacteroidaceae bacterium]|nr:HU family DNA-binding protein [Bacteroidaceae bacterium]
MSVNYRVTKVKNPKGIEDVEYFAARVAKTSDYSFEDLATDINNSTTVTRADALAVLNAAQPFIEKALLNGQAVVLSGLGRFQISLQGKCYPKETMQSDEFMPASMIKSHKILFRAEPKLKKNIAAGISYKRVKGEHDVN